MLLIPVHPHIIAFLWEYLLMWLHVGFIFWESRWLPACHCLNFFPAFLSLQCLLPLVAALVSLSTRRIVVLLLWDKTCHEIWRPFVFDAAHPSRPDDNYECWTRLFTRSVVKVGRSRCQICSNVPYDFLIFLFSPQKNSNAVWVSLRAYKTRPWGFKFLYTIFFFDHLWDWFRVLSSLSTLSWIEEEGREISVVHLFLREAIHKFIEFMIKIIWWISWITWYNFSFLYF